MTIDEYIGSLFERWNVLVRQAVLGDIKVRHLSQSHEEEALLAENGIESNEKRRC